MIIDIVGVYGEVWPEEEEEEEDEKRARAVVTALRGLQEI